MHIGKKKTNEVTWAWLPAATKVWPVEGAQAHTKLDVELGGGEGRGAMSEEWKGEGRRKGRINFPETFLCLWRLFPRLLRTTLQTSGRILSLALSAIPSLYSPIIKTFSALAR